MAATVDPTLLTVNEVHELLPISLPQIYALIREHKIPAVKIGKRIFVKQADLDTILMKGIATL